MKSYLIPRNQSSLLLTGYKKKKNSLRHLIHHYMYTERIRFMYIMKCYRSLFIWLPNADNMHAIMVAFKYIKNYFGTFCVHNKPSQKAKNKTVAYFQQFRAEYTSCFINSLTQLFYMHINVLWSKKVQRKILIVQLSYKWHTIIMIENVQFLLKND